MWIIDSETVTEGTSLKSRVGWKSVDYKEGAELKFKFRMLDDDGNVYYTGRSNDNNSEDAFDPLDDLGTPDAGATTIQYKNGNKWETL